MELKMENPKQTVPFDQVITALLDIKKPFPPTYLHQFSDLESSNLKKLTQIWDQIDPKRQIALMQDLEELAENDTLMSFDDIAKLVIKDKESEVRACAIRMLWDCEDTRLIPIFIDILQHDENPYVRSNAARGLGIFVYRGELEAISPDQRRIVEACLLDVLGGNDLDLIRRSALESLGYSGRPAVTKWIQKSYKRNEPEWQSSALIAMGRSADERWEKAVLRKLNNPDISVQEEAVRAAGLLGISVARPILIEMLEEPDLIDYDVYMAAIWSLSQIGGEGVSGLLDLLHEKASDDDETSFIEEAIDNLEFTEGLPSLNLLEVADYEDEDMGTIIDLENDDGDDTAESK
jgi:hypothetical protein